MPKGGSIINSASVQAYKPSPHLLEYAMTNGAIVTFTQGLAQMVAKDGIRVNAVAPVPVWTPLIPATMPDTAEFGKQSPSDGQPSPPTWHPRTSSSRPRRPATSPPRSSTRPAAHLP